LDERRNMIQGDDPNEVDKRSWVSRKLLDVYKKRM
jgi:hypothetical protein